MATLKGKVARQRAYRREFADQATKLCTLGATHEEVAAFFGVVRQTIYKWERTHPEFAQALAEGIKHAADRVEHSLFRCAVGYTREVVKVFFPRGKSEPVLVPYEEQVPPDARAALAWLKHRCPDAWRERRARGGKDAAAGDAAPEPEKTVIVLPHNGRD